MNGKPGGLLVAGDYGASDEESEHETSQYVDMNIRRSHTSSALQEPEQTKKGQHYNTDGLHSPWSVLYDQTSGYPYYWNPTTNEVSWDKPAEAALRNTNTTSLAKRTRDEGKSCFGSSNVCNVEKTCQEPLSSDGKPAKSKWNKSSVKSKSGKTSKSDSSKGPVFIGPSLPPHQIEESLPYLKEKDFAEVIIREIQDDLPIDWITSNTTVSNKSQDILQKVFPEKKERLISSSARPCSIYNQSFSWKKREAASAVVEKMKNKKSPSSSNSSTGGSNPIALIAHGYGDDDESGNDENELQEVDHKILKVKEYSQENNSGTPCNDTAHIKHDMKTSFSGYKNRKRKIELKVKSSKLAKDSNSQSLQPSAAIFQESQHDTDDDETIPNEQCDEPEKETDSPDNSDFDSNGDLSDPSKSNKDVKHNSKTKGFDTITGPTYKKSIDNIAEILCDKLEALNVHDIRISPLKLLAIQVETMFEAWHNSALSAGYMQKFLSKMQREMAQLEAQELAPPGWRVIWNRSVKKYQYESLITGEIQEEKPKDDEDQRGEITQLLKLQESEDGERTSSSCTENGTSGGPSTGDNTVAKYRLQQPGPAPFESLQDITFPPLPPLPPKDILGSPTPAVPPLPIDDCSTDAILPCPPPPPPPDPLPHEEKIEQLNTSTDQVQDMDLSDGDEDCDDGEVQQTNLLHMKMDPSKTSCITQDDSTTENSTKTASQSQIMQGNIVYNNHPHLYQNYYQDYSPQVPQDETSTDLPKGANEASVGPLNDALSSFYSDLAVIDNIPEEASTNHFEIKTTDRTTHRDEEEPNSYGASSIGNINFGMLDDSSNSPRAPTADRVGQEEKEKRKKKAKLASGLSMKKKGVSNMVAKWQNIQDESSKQRPQ